MIAVVQRVHEAACVVEGKVVGASGKGLLVFVGARKEDVERDAAKLADRIIGVRLFEDEAGKINLNLADATAETGQANLLVISNFTLYGDAWASRRPSFMRAAGFEHGQAMYQSFLSELRRLGGRVEEGIFGAEMRIQAVNDGPVTMIIHTDDLGE